MNSTYLYERDGVTLHVEYTVEPDGVLKFESIRVLGSDYQPCGPELLEFMHPLVLMYQPTVGEPLLSVIVGEIQNEHERH